MTHRWSRHRVAGEKHRKPDTHTGSPSQHWACRQHTLNPHGPLSVLPHTTSTPRHTGARWGTERGLGRGALGALGAGRWARGRGARGGAGAGGAGARGARGRGAGATAFFYIWFCSWESNKSAPSTSKIVHFTSLIYTLKVFKWIIKYF